MNRLVIIVVTAIVIVVAGSIITLISWRRKPPPPVTVSINAIPWARVFIKLPGSHDFIEPRAQDFTIQPAPNQKKSNVTPIRGGLKVPIGTTIKLVYEEKDKIFPYEAWKAEKTISYDFLNQ